MPVCVFFLGNQCKFGDDCKYSHVAEQVVQQAVCPFFLQGSCLYGTRCNNLHPAPNRQRTSVNNQRVSLANTPRFPCKFFSSGRCKNGTECPFSHNASNVEETPSDERENASTTVPAEVTESEDSQIANENQIDASDELRVCAVNSNVSHPSPLPCKYFVNGNCLKGLQCSFKHASDSVLSPLLPDNETYVPFPQNDGHTPQTLGDSSVVGRLPKPHITPDANTELCKYFALGACARADQCRFRHSGAQMFTSSSSATPLQLATSPSQRQLLHANWKPHKICRFFENGSCARGEACSFLHASESQSTPSVFSSQDNYEQEQQTSETDSSGHWARSVQEAGGDQVESTNDSNFDWNWATNSSAASGWGDSWDPVPETKPVQEVDTSAWGDNVTTEEPDVTAGWGDDAITKESDTATGWGDDAINDGNDVVAGWGDEVNDANDQTGWGGDQTTSSRLTVENNGAAPRTADIFAVNDAKGWGASDNGGWGSSRNDSWGVSAAESSDQIHEEVHETAKTLFRRGRGEQASPKPNQDHNVCYAFSAQGSCSRGNKCRFRHDNSGERLLCIHYQRGTCRHGARCYRSHDLDIRRKGKYRSTPPRDPAPHIKSQPAWTYTIQPDDPQAAKAEPYLEVADEPTLDYDAELSQSSSTPPTTVPPLTPPGLSYSPLQVPTGSPLTLNPEGHIELPPCVVPTSPHLIPLPGSPPSPRFIPLPVSPPSPRSIPLPDSPRYSNHSIPTIPSPSSLSAPLPVPEDSYPNPHPDPDLNDSNTRRR